jgi:hypothetical protein
VGVQPASQIGRHILSSHPVVKTRSLKTELPQETERLVDGKGSLEEPNEIIARGLYCLHQKFPLRPHSFFRARGLINFAITKSSFSHTMSAPTALRQPEVPSFQSENVSHGIFVQPSDILFTADNQ